MQTRIQLTIFEEDKDKLFDRQQMLEEALEELGWEKMEEGTTQAQRKEQIYIAKGKEKHLEHCDNSNSSSASFLCIDIYNDHGL